MACPCSAAARSTVTDGLDDFDADLAIRRSLWKKQKLLPPLGQRMPIRRSFDRLLMLMTIYTGVSAPIFSCFYPLVKYSTSHLVVDYLIDALFWLDIVVNLRTAFYDINYELVVNARDIRTNYLRKRLLIDVLANFPFELLALAAGQHTDSPYFASWRLFRLLRFFRIKKLHPVLVIDLNESAARRLVRFFPLIIHWVACLWWYIGVTELKKPGYDDPSSGRASWLVRPPSGTTHRLDQADLGEAYISVLYWAASILMKTAWIAPNTTVELCFASSAVLMGAIMFAVFLGQVFKMIARLDEGSAQRREKISTIQAFLNRNKISRKNSHNVLSYALAEWNVTQGVSASETLKLLPKNLSSQVLYEMRKDLLESCTLLAQPSLACAKALLVRATVQVCLKNEYVVAYNELARELFILVSGSFQISLPSRKTMRQSKGSDDTTRPASRSMSKKQHMQFRMLEKQGAITGMWNPYESNLRFPFDVQAKEFSTMLNINRKAVQEAMNIFDEDRPIIRDILEREYDLVMQALGKGKSTRDSRLSSDDTGDAAGGDASESNATDQQSQSRTVEMKAALEGIQCGVDKALQEIAEAKLAMGVLPDILGALGVSGTAPVAAAPPAAAPSAPPSSSNTLKNSSSGSSLERRQMNAKKRQEDTESLDDKREITVQRGNQQVGSNTHAIVL